MKAVSQDTSRLVTHTHTVQAVHAVQCALGPYPHRARRSPCRCSGRAYPTPALTGAASNHGRALPFFTLAVRYAVERETALPPTPPRPCSLHTGAKLGRNWHSVAGEAAA